MSGAQLDGRWRLTVPPEVRAALHLSPGDDVVFVLDDRGGARMVSRRALIEEFHGAGSGKGAVDELIASRRAEAAREEAEAERISARSGGDGSTAAPVPRR